MKFSIIYDSKLKFDLDLGDQDTATAEDNLEQILKLCSILGACIGELTTKIVPLEEKQDSVFAMQELLKFVKKGAYEKIRRNGYIDADTRILDELI